MKPETGSETNTGLTKLTKKYWTSVDDLNRDPNMPAPSDSEFLMTPLDGDSTDGVDSASRREFLKVMGAGLAMVGATACTRRPVEKIVPYLKKPEEMTPGIANWYASTCAECDSGCGILVKTREGRPLKFEGNPNHPTSDGGLCARGQASVLNLYDPDRLQAPLTVGRKGSFSTANWDQLDSKVVGKLRELRSAGGRVRVLTGEMSSPSKNRVIQEFLGGFSAGKRVVYEPMGHEEISQAAELSYGSRIVPRYRFDRAQMIVSFGADFLGNWLSPVEFNKGFSKNRKVGKNAAQAGGKQMSRFVAFESVMTLTGANADERYRVKSGDELKIALAIAHELIVKDGHSRFSGDSAVRSALDAYSAAAISGSLGIPAEVIRKTAKELWENRGKSLVVGGGYVAKGDQGVALEVAVNLLNSALENEGSTVETASVVAEKSSYQELQKLISDMKSGQVDALLIEGSNPVYTLPKSLGFADALSKVGLVVTFTTHFDETAQASDFAAALHHHTETWGDANPYSFVYSIQQPTISPLYATRGFGETLMVWAKQLGLGGAIASSSSWHEYVRSTWRDQVHHQFAGSSFELFWDNVLREGVAKRAPAAERTRSFATKALSSFPKFGWNGGMTLALYPKISMFDGRGYNNGWLQELPDPVTKITWDNYASMSPAAAQKLGVKEGDVVRLKSSAGAVELPTHIQPGMHDQTIAAAVGYGRAAKGEVGHSVGVDVFPMAMAGSQAMNMAGLSVNVEKTGRSYALAATQKHHSLEGRPVIREASLKEYRHNAKAGNEEHEENITLWPRHKYEGYRWAMAIDLNSCTGCSACMIGCQSENNIPVVGKKFVMTSREMHWLRIDRYYSGNAENPETLFQPMLCQHCENAPCETVCPVLATMHDHEGLSQQVYNRCVGTRYCANNCPYKVRRFNWFTFTEVAPSLRLQYNPDETVRTRGVMEKCSFCMQRIRAAKDTAKDMGIRVKDGDLKTACQQSCPTDAIIFGDINDKGSKIAQINTDPRGYHVLAELNTRPSITYLTKIRNKDA